MATTNNIGLYCFDTGNEDAKTSLEALFGAGNSNMKKIDDAIGELKKKSFIVNTEAELNALLTEENLGKTVSFNGALYIITKGGSTNAPIAVGDTIDKLYFNTSVENIDLAEFSYGESGLITLIAGDSDFSLQVGDMAVASGGQMTGHYIFSSVDNTIFYSDFDASEMGITLGWNTSIAQNNGEWSFGYTTTIAEINQDTVWGSFISKEPFGASTGGGIIAKPVGTEGGSLPSFAPEDAGKFLRVDSNGNIVAEAIAYAEGESF